MQLLAVGVVYVILIVESHWSTVRIMVIGICMIYGEYTEISSSGHLTSPQRASIKWGRWGVAACSCGDSEALRPRERTTRAEKKITNTERGWQCRGGLRLLRLL